MQSKFVHASLLIKSSSRSPDMTRRAFSLIPSVQLRTLDHSHRALSRHPIIYRVQKRKKRSHIHSRKLTRPLQDEVEVDEFHD